MTTPPENLYGNVELAPTPTYPGSLRGYRAFDCYVDDRIDGPMGWALKSVFIDYVYSRGQNHATCMRRYYQPPVGQHSAPEASCVCGFYAAHGGLPMEYLRHRLFGVVKATGRILISTIGFRAQTIEIEALALQPTPAYIDIDGGGNMLRWLGDKFHVPVFPDPKEMLAAFPPQDLTGLVPEVNYSNWYVCAELPTRFGPYVVKTDWRDYVLISPEGTVHKGPTGVPDFEVCDGHTAWVITCINGRILSMVIPGRRHVNPGINLTAAVPE